MTNGNKFLEVYPNLYVCVLYLDFNYMHVRDRNVEYDIDDNKTCMKMPIDWWNAEYKALEQEPKTGHWILGVCDNCRYDWSKDALIASVPNFCPNCGAKKVSHRKVRIYEKP